MQNSYLVVKILNTFSYTVNISFVVAGNTRSTMSEEQTQRNFHEADGKLQVWRKTF